MKKGPKFDLIDSSGLAWSWKFLLFLALFLNVESRLEFFLSPAYYKSWHFECMSVWTRLVVLITDDSDCLFQWGGFWFLQWSDDSSKGKTLERQVRMENEWKWMKNYHSKMNLINSTSDSITCLSLFSSHRSETWHECVTRSSKVKCWKPAVRCISPSCNMPWSVLLFRCFLGDWIFL